MKEKMKNNCMPRQARIALIIMLSLTMACLLAACGGSQTADTAAGAKGALRLATTTSTKDSGLLAEILPDFETKTG
ncbi:MAG: hypothetical protein LBJ21_08645, partial [Acidobacteriota bacterium]|nr:hypothetical protein [Acidobacteriota bacterium]